MSVYGERDKEKSVYAGRDKEKYDMLASLISLASNSTFLSEGASVGDLCERRSNDGADDLVENGYAVRTKKHGEVFYKLTDGGKRHLDNILDSVDL